MSRLYRVVLKQADFIATTPVAAYGQFASYFHPDLIFVDEASHARELTTLIPLAYFTPLVWIFSGDVKQTRPFVKDSKDHDRSCSKDLQFNPYAAQLRFSTMARAEAVSAVTGKLFVNKRAHAHLHRLPSKLFYSGEMVSPYADTTMYPPSVMHLRGCLERLCGRTKVDENRLIVSFPNSQEELHGDSFWNPIHHRWVLIYAESVLRDADFRSVHNSDCPGTIMVATPYNKAAKQYSATVQRWPKELQDRIEVLTVDKAQGNEADLVLLDLVRTTKAGFMDDPQRLNVAITRARQAEIIVMHPAMVYLHRSARRMVISRYLSQLWDDTSSHNRIVQM